MKRAMLMAENDNVATALEILEEDDLIRVVSPSQKVLGEISIIRKVPFGHKVAVKKLTQGDPVIKYGHRIGQAIADIGKGDYVHIHNVASNRMQLPEVWYRK